MLLKIQEKSLKITKIQVIIFLNNFIIILYVDHYF